MFRNVRFYKLTFQKFKANLTEELPNSYNLKIKEIFSCHKLVHLFIDLFIYLLCTIINLFTYLFIDLLFCFLCLFLPLFFWFGFIFIFLMISAPMRLFFRVFVHITNVLIAEQKI